MRLSLVCLGEGATGFQVYEEALNSAKSLNILADLSTSKLREWMESENDFDEEIVLEGKRPVHGRDGYFEEAVDMSAAPKFVPDEDDEAVDFKESMKISLVEPGDLLGKMVPPTAGTHGENLCGDMSEADPGEPANIHLGEGVEQRGHEYYALVKGMPCIVDGCVMVRDLYQVSGDVDYESGNVRFPGSIFIQGNVKEGFEVAAGGNLTIQGRLEGGIVSAGGSVRILGGILGRDKALVNAGNNIEVRFCEQATLEAGGEIMVSRDIRHSTVSSLKSIQVKGGIVGGECMVLECIESMELGNDIGTKTRVHVGKHFLQEKARAEENEVTEAANKIWETCRPWLRGTPVPADKLNVLQQSHEEMDLLYTRRIKLAEKVLEYDSVLQGVDFPHILIKKTIWPDVLCLAPFCVHTFLEASKGRMVLSPDADAGDFTLSHG